mmetsp:Transcript_143812/g.459516  ORF Transcript_143812/g.459516 Transcript_143812/m.459516 type:complete len:690 (+) Transcript_143812:69-2138(+)
MRLTNLHACPSVPGMKRMKAVCSAWVKDEDKTPERRASSDKSASPQALSGPMQSPDATSESAGGGGEGVLASVLTADRLAVAAQHIMQARRLSKSLSVNWSTAVKDLGEKSSKAMEASSVALANVDEKLKFSERVRETAAAADAKLGLMASAAAVDEKYRISVRAAAIRQDFAQDWEGFSAHTTDVLAKGAGGVNKENFWNNLNKAVVNHISSLGPPRKLMSALDPSALCFYDVKRYPGVAGCIALTIDDAPCHVSDPACCMLKEVKELLEEFHAKATFFLCTDFVPGHEDDLVALLQDGHEVANHGGADRSYSGDSEEDFEEQFLKSECVCEELRQRVADLRKSSPTASPSSSPTSDANASSACDAAGDPVVVPADAAPTNVPTSAGDAPVAAAGAPATVGSVAAAAAPAVSSAPAKTASTSVSGSVTDGPGAPASGASAAAAAAPAVSAVPAQAVSTSASDSVTDVPSAAASGASADGSTAAGPASPALLPSNAPSTGDTGTVLGAAGADVSSASLASPLPALPPSNAEVGFLASTCGNVQLTRPYAPPPRAPSTSSPSASSSTWPSGAELASRPRRWFRAPHADAGPEMHRVLQRHGFTNVLCDSFANDTIITDPDFIASTLLSLIDPQGGSIVVIHTPERGFREHNFEALRLFLQAVADLNLSVLSVSGLTRAAHASLSRSPSSS